MGDASGALSERSAAAMGTDAGAAMRTGMMTSTGTTNGGAARQIRRRRMTREELAVWRAFLRAHAQVVRRLEADLVAEHDLPLASYDVLVQLVEAPGRRLRMTELADLVLLSRSGLTRLVDRLAREGLVRREACESDARGLFTVLTDAGYERLRSASRTHLRGVEDYAVGRFTPGELRVFAELLAHMAHDDA